MSTPRESRVRINLTGKAGGKKEAATSAPTSRVRINLTGKARKKNQ